MSIKPVIYVKIGGKKRPVRYGRAAFAEFSDKANLPAEQMPELAQGATLKHIACMIWAGLWDGARKEQTGFSIDGRDVDVHDVQDWLDDMTDAEADEVQAQIMGHVAASQSNSDADAKQNGQKKTSKKQSSGVTS